MCEGVKSLKMVLLEYIHIDSGCTNITVFLSVVFLYFIVHSSAFNTLTLVLA